MRRSLPEMSEAEISQLDFSSVVALVDEPNTPSGAHESIRTILTAVPADRFRRVLDVGSNTGFATLEIASWLDAEVVGLDINPDSVALASERAAALGLSNARFVEGSLLDLPFEADSFDLVYCNNVTSFVRNRTQALAQYTRVLRPMGVLAAVPIYYRETPPQSVVDDVSRAIGAPIDPRGIEQWLECFSEPGLDLIYRKDFVYDRLSDERIADYASRVVAEQRTPWLTDVQRRAAHDRLEGMYRLFERNLSYCGFSVLLFRWRGPNPSDVLHTSRPAARP